MDILQWVFMTLVYWLLIAKVTPKRYQHWAGRVLFLTGLVATFTISGAVAAYTATAVAVGVAFSFKVSPESSAD